MEKFDYVKAKKEGYSDEEIQTFLTSEYDFGFDIVGAKKEGYSDQEITDYFSTLDLKKKVGTQPSSTGAESGASAVQSTESEVFKPKRIGEAQIEGEAVDIFQYPKTEVTESPFTDELKATLKKLPTEALVAANEIKKLKRKPTPQELQGIQDKYGITKPEEVDALTKYLEFGLKGEKTIEPKTATQEDIGFWESSGNSVKNIGTSLEGFTPRLNVLAADIWENVFGKELAAGYYKWEGRDIEQVRNNAYTKLAELEKQMLPTRGLVESGKKKDLAGLAAGTVDAMTAIFSTAIPSLMTGGAGLVTEMVGGSLVDYNNIKAEEKGVTIEELYQKGDAELAAPTIIGSISAATEGIGLKGVGKYINQNIKSIGTKKVADLLLTFNKEGLTEFVQTGLEDANNVLAKGGSVEEASKAAADGMFSEKGLEAYLKGGVGASGTAIAGRFIKGKYNALTKKNQEQTDKLQQESEVAKQIANNPSVSKEAKEAVSKEVQETETAIQEIQKQEIEVYNSIEDKSEIDNLINEKNRLETIIKDEGITEEQKQVFVSKLEQVNSGIDKIFNDKLKELETLTSGTATTPTVSEPIQQTETTAQEQGVEETVSESVSEVGDGTAEATTAVLEEAKPIRQLGTGANVYFETPKYRVNDNKDGILLNVGNKNDEVPLQSVQFDDVNEAVFVAKKLEEVAPEGLVADFHNVDKIIENLKKEYQDQLKPKADAVQIESPAEVPIQPKAEDSGKVEKGTPEAKPESVTEEGKEEVKPKKEKVFDYRQKKRQGDQLKKNKAKFANKMQVATPFDWLVRFFVSGGRMDAKEAKDISGYGSKDLFGFIKEGGTKVDDMITQISEELNIEFDEVNFRGITVGEVLQLARVKAAKKGEKGNSIYDYAKRLMPNQNEIAQDEQAELGEELTPEQIQKLNNEAEIQRQIEDELKNKKAAELVPVLSEVVNGLSDAEINDFYKFFNIFRDADGNINWISIQEGINDPESFDGESVYMALDRLPKETKDKIINLINQENVRTRIKEIRDNQAINFVDPFAVEEKPIEKDRRAELESRLAEAKNEVAQAEKELAQSIKDFEQDSAYKKAKASLDKDIQERQKDLFQMGAQAPLIDDLADKQRAVDKIKAERESVINESRKKLEAAKEKEQTVQQLLDDNLKGQKSLLDRLDDLKIKGGDLTGGLMLAPKLFNGFIDAIKAGIKAGMILGDAIKKGIDYLKANGVTDVEPYLNEIEINAKEPNLKREIQKLIKRKPTEQKRIDKAYALGVADTKETFKAKLDEMKSDFKEFLGFQAEQTKQAVQAEKAKGESKLSQERYMKKQITDLIKSALDKDFISQRTFETIMNRLGKAKTPNQYQKLFDYISKAAEQADYAERMSEVSKLQSQANKRNHTSLTKAVKDFTSINPELISDNLLPQYIQALDELSGRVPSYKTMQDIYLQVMASKQPPKAFDEITTLAKAQELYNQIGLNQVKNVEEYVNLFKDINSFKRKILQLIDNEINPTIIQGYEQMLEDIGKDQRAVEAKYATEIEAIKREMIADLRNSINSTSTVGQTPPEKALLSDFFDLTDAELENLSPEELYNLQSILDNVKEYGYVDVFRLNPLVIKAKTYGKPTTELSNQIKKAKSFNEAFRDKFEAVRKLGGTFSSFWETTLGLQNLGMGAFTKYIAAPMEKAVASYRREVENAYSDYVKIKEKYGIQNDKPFGIKKTLMDKAGKETNQMTKLGMISTYLREYAMSFDEKYAGKKDADQMTFGTRDWFAEILNNPKKRSNYTKEEIDRIREVHNKLPKVNGKVDVKAVWDSYVNGTNEFLTKNEMSYLKEVNQWKEKNITDKQKYANELRGKSFDELLFHIKRMRKEGGKSSSDPVEINTKNNNIRIAAGSGKEVTNDNVGAIEVDFEKIFTESVEETYRDFYMTPFLQEQSALLNNVEKNIPEDKYEYIVTTKENLQAALNNEFANPTIKGYEKIIRNLTLAKAAQVLIAPIRTGYEMISSYVSYPFRAGALNSFSETFRNKDAVKKLLEFTNSPLLNKADVNKHFDVVKGNVEGKGMLEKAIDFFAAMPERNMVNLVWMASFDNEFKKITGKDFDRTRINDKAYLRENKKSIEEAGAISDMVYQQISGATTSAGTRRFALPQGKIAKALGLEGVTAKSTGGQIITFFTNYPFRETEQWLKSARGIKDMAKDRNVTSENAKYVLYPIVGTFLGASLYQFMQALGFQAKNYLTALYGDDDEEEEKAKIEIERITSPEGIINEMIAGAASTAGTRYGAITKAALQLAGTMAFNLSDNEKLREKGKAITRELTFKNPLELRKKDGTINTYGLKGEIASQITSYIPFLQVIVDNTIKLVEGAGGLEYLYDKVEKGESLTNDEKDTIIAVQSAINITNFFINFAGKAFPFTSEIERLGREVKKEQSTTKQGSTLGTVIEVSPRQAQ